MNNVAASDREYPQGLEISLDVANDNQESIGRRFTREMQYQWDRRSSGEWWPDLVPSGGPGITPHLFWGMNRTQPHTVR